MRCAWVVLCLLSIGLGVGPQSGARAEPPAPPVTTTTTTTPVVAEGPDALAAAPAAQPGTTTTVAAELPAKKAARPMYRGSEVSYRNWISALTLDRSAELTYNPTWVMEVEVAPRLWIGDVFNVGVTVGFQHELTNADDTTQRGETLLNDVGIRLNASKFATIPGAGIDLSASLGVTLPTSLASQGDTVIMGLSPSLRLAKTFDAVLEGLTFGYTFRFTKTFHRFTTSETETPLIAGCRGEGCDRYLTTGARNASYRVSNGFDVALGITEWLDVSANFAVVVSWLYDDVEDDRVSLVTIPPTDNRYALVGDIGLSFHPWKPLDIGLGATTVNPQLTPDGHHYAPFFNRFTALYLDLRLDVAALIADLAKE